MTETHELASASFLAAAPSILAATRGLDYPSVGLCESFRRLYVAQSFRA